MRKQRIINIVCKHPESSYFEKDLDEYTSKLNEEGWEIAQVVSMSFKFGKCESPGLVFTLLIEKADNLDGD